MIRAARMTKQSRAREEAVNLAPAYLIGMKQ